MTINATTPKDTVLQFLQTLREEGADAAYEAASGAFKTAVSRDQFSRFVFSYGLDSWVPREMVVDRFLKRRLVRFIGFATDKRDEEYATIIFVEMQAGRWHVAGLSFRKRGMSERYRIPGHPLHTHVL